MDNRLTRKDAEMEKLKDSELLSKTDSRVWAQQFNLIFAELHEGTTLDEGWLIGWFANAIETGRAAGQRSIESVREEALEIIRRAIPFVAAYPAESERAGELCAEILLDMNRALQHSPARVAEDDELSRHLEGEHHAIRAQEIDSPTNTCSLKETCQWVKRIALQRAPESPAKEQPGEQNANERRQGHKALRVRDGELETFDPHPPATTSAAPDVAAMVRRLNERVNGKSGNPMFRTGYKVGVDEIVAELFSVEWIPVSAIWLRRIGPHAEVLFEQYGKWRFAIREYLDSNFSHIIEHGGMEKAPLDEPPPPERP